MYEDVLTLGRETPGLFDRGLAALGAEGVAPLRAAHPGLPEAYFTFLAQVGWGSFGGSRFMLYDVPLTPEEAFIRDGAVAGMLIVGDDFGGNFIALRPDTETVFEFGGKLNEVAPDFGNFMRTKLAALARKR